MQRQIAGSNALVGHKPDVNLIFAEDRFDSVFQSLPPVQRQVFEHEQARLVFEADIFWATDAIGADELTTWLSVYQLSREMEPRGIVEVDIDD